MADEAHTPLLEDNAEQHLLFRLGEGLYAIPVRFVNEIVLLPELMPIDERPPCCIGVANVRGDIVPVLDLQLRLGRSGSLFSVDDSLLVLEHSGRLAAMVVNETLGVHRLATQASDADESATPRASGAPCVQRVVTIDGAIVMLLDLDQVLTPLHEVTMDAENPALRYSSAEAPPEDRAEFRRRAEDLRQLTSEEDTDKLAPFAVAEINQEYFAFDLQFVREFCDVQHIARVPCCPEHIVGNVNVRGDVLTVIDIRRELNLPPLGRVSGGKIIVARTEELTVGLLVDELHGVVYRSNSELPNRSSEAATSSQQTVMGTVPFRDGMMCVLDLRVLLEIRRWVVDEEVSHA